MKNFTTTVLTSCGLKRELVFKKIHAADPARYHVSIGNKENRTTYYFDMKLKEDRWKIINAPKILDWILELERKSEHAILEKCLYF